MRTDILEKDRLSSLKNKYGKGAAGATANGKKDEKTLVKYLSRTKQAKIVREAQLLTVD